MRTQSRDTSEQAEAVQIELLRQKGGAHRFAMMQSLTEFTIRLSKQAIQRVHPEYSETEVKVEFVSLNYGVELAGKVREALQRSDQRVYDRPEGD